MIRPALLGYLFLETGLGKLGLFAGEDDGHPAVLADGPLPMPLAPGIGAVGKAVATGEISVDRTGNGGGLHLPEAGLHRPKVEAKGGDILPGLQSKGRAAAIQLLAGLTVQSILQHLPVVVLIGLVLHRVGEVFVPGPGADGPQAQGIGGQIIPPVEVIQGNSGGVGDVLEVISDNLLQMTISENRKIQDLSFLEKASHLQILNLYNLSRITTLPLSKLPHLSVLHISGLHKLTDMESLAQSNVQYLNIKLSADKVSATRMADVLLRMPSLRALNIGPFNRVQCKKTPIIRRQFEKAGQSDIITLFSLATLVKEVEGAGAELPRALPSVAEVVHKWEIDENTK